MMKGGAGRRQGLPRSARLRWSGEFRSIRERGRRVVRGCLVANWVELKGGEGSRVGVVTSKKVGGAVERNRARRLLREAFRRHRGELARPVDLVLVARPSIRGLGRDEVERDLIAVMRGTGMLAAGRVGGEGGGR